MNLHADYQTGLNAYQAGDYETALAEWKEEVNRPRVPTNLAVYREALYAIGMLYWQGEGVGQDYTVAAVWLKQAADINHPGAQNKLGYLYSTGQGVPENYQQARRWFEMAAAQGDPDAIHNLDLMFQRGLFAEAEEAAAAIPDSLAKSDPAPEPRLEAAPPPDTGGQSEPGPVAALTPRPDMQPEPDPDAASPARTGMQPEPGPAVAPPPLPETQPAQPDTRVPVIPAAAPPQPGTPTSGPDPDAAWILAQNPEHYTIQVIALRSADNLRAFIAANTDWEPFAIYTPAGNERPLWVLIQGVYPDLESAQAAAAEFPQELQAREGLWIRRLGMVQDMLR